MAVAFVVASSSSCADDGDDDTSTSSSGGATSTGAGGQGAAAGSGGGGAAGGDAGGNGGDGGGGECTTTYDDCNADVSDGCETHLFSDSEHCGVCGHSCGGGDCDNGVCQPVAIDNGHVLGIDYDALVHEGDYLYFTGSASTSVLPTQSGVFRLAKSGGDPELLADTCADCSHLVLEGDWLYVLDGQPFNGAALRRVHKVTGALETVLADDVERYDVAGSELLWRTPTQGEVFTQPIGGAATPFEDPSLIWFNQARHDDQYWYFCNHSIAGINRFARAGGGILESISTAKASEMIPRGDTLYLLYYGTPNDTVCSTNTGSVHALPLDGGTIQTLDSGGAQQGALNFGANDLFWISCGGSGRTIQRHTLQSGTTEVVLQAGKNVRQLTADDDFLFYFDNLNIYRLAH